MKKRDPLAPANRIKAMFQWLLIAITLIVLPTASALAQSQAPAKAQSGAQAEKKAPSKPMNLGDIIQKNTLGNRAPKRYLKLPESVPVPQANPLKAGGQTAPGQVAPGSINGEGTQQTPAAQAQNGNSAAPNALAPTQQPVADPASQNGQAAAPVELTEEPAEPKVPEPEPGGIATLQLTALLSDQGEILQRGVNWRIFAEKPNVTGGLEPLQTVDGGTVSVELATGSYIVYAGYGFANLTKRIVLDRSGAYTETFVLRAGAVRLNAVASGDIPLDTSILTFDIYSRDANDGGGQQLVTKNVKPNHVVKLSEGTYHVVSSYGVANAKVRGDVQIEAGKLVNVTMLHNAAKITLRLVSEPGGEALANTIWTVLTPGGDIVKQAIGAFPTLALTAGDYTAIAKQGDQVYNRDFSVDSGLDRDIEVLASAR